MNRNHTVVRVHQLRRFPVWIFHLLPGYFLFFSAPKRVDFRNIFQDYLSHNSDPE